MDVIQKLTELLHHPEKIWIALGYIGLLNCVSDERYLKIAYYLQTKKKLNLISPITFNEKIQWLKIHNRQPQYTNLVDKFAVREHISKMIGAEYLIPLLGVWNNSNDIDFASLPKQFVLKCTHDSGSVIICKDKDTFDINKAKRKLDFSMKLNHYNLSREWPYKNIKPRIIAEKFMEDKDYDSLNVYKIFTFNGTPKLIQTIQNDKTPHATIDYFDTEWNKLDLHQVFPNSEKILSRPEMLEEMLHLSEILSENIPFVRTDFYIIDGKIYFSEFTFFPDSGLSPFYPDTWDTTFGDWIELPSTQIV